MKQFLNAELLTREEQDYLVQLITKRPPGHIAMVPLIEKLMKLTQEDW